MRHWAEVLTMNARTRQLALLAITLSLGDLSVAYSRAQEPEISIRIQPTKKVFLKGKPITIRVELTNRGQSDLYISRSLSWPGGDDGYLDFQVWNSGGQPSPRGGIAVDCFMQPSPEPLSVAVMKRWIALSPGSSYSKTLDVDLSLILKRTGRYRILATYGSGGLREEYFTHCVKVTPEETAKLPFPAWEGKIESNSVWVRIIDPRKRKAPS
jgi:hypothetical protein